MWFKNHKYKKKKNQFQEFLRFKETIWHKKIEVLKILNEFSLVCINIETFTYMKIMYLLLLMLFKIHMNALFCIS